MDTRGNGRIAHQDEEWFGILAAVRIVVPVVAVAIVAIAVVTVPRRTKVTFAQVVKRHGV